MTLTPPFVSIDLETTGLDPDRDQIIEVGAVRFADGEVLGTFHRMVQPSVDLALRTQRITGIRPEELEGAPPIAVVIPDLLAFIDDAPLVGQSVEFDIGFLRRQGPALDQPQIDTFELGAIMVPEADRYSLDALVSTMGVEAAPSHRALDDALAAMRLYEALYERVRRLPRTTLGAINRMAERIDWPLGRVFRMAAADPLPASRSGPLPADPVEPLRPADTPQAVDVDELEARLAPGGAMADLMPAFEDRPQQREMLRRVAEAFNVGDRLLVEAGTGTGKSLAYLLPAAQWARLNGRPTVVATHTIPLQDQLLDHDLPLVDRITDGALRTAVLKGRSNYLCRTRLEKLVERDDLDVDTVRAAAKLLVWAPRTTTGDRAELFLLGAEERAWRLVNADGQICTADRCPHAARADCWVHRARARAAGAHVIIVSHALLISDVLTDNNLLPPYQQLVVDEAHHLEPVATRSLGFDASGATVRDALAPLAGSGRAAITTRLLDAIRPIGLPPDTADNIREATVAIREVASKADDAAKELDAQLASFFQEASGGGFEVRLTDAKRHGAEWQGVEMAWQSLVDPLLDAQRRAASLGQALLAIDDMLADDDPLVADMTGVSRELAELADELERVISNPAPEDITWLSEPRGRPVTIHRAPLYVADTLSRDLFGDKHAVVLTSATMRAPGFDFMRERLGLPEAEGVAIASPFDYAEQCLMLVPTDLPEPNQSGYQEGLAAALTALARASEGRTMALFTSHSALRSTYHRIRGPLAEDGINVVGQGLDGSRHRLLQTLRDPEGPTVLLGTRSFWEGVDVPGDALSCLAITRIPFDVPSDPVFAARAETFQEPFMDYSVPQALLRFRQGFGRLIRKRSDRGVVAMLDARVRTKRYGEVFLQALPPCRQHVGPIATMGLAARRFLAGEAGLDDYPSMVHSTDDDVGDFR